MAGSKERLEENIAYCTSEVRDNAPDLYLSVQFAERAVRKKLLAVYAFGLEIHKIPATVSEPPLGAIRQQWWREALDEIFGEGTVRVHPVVEALDAVLDECDAATIRPLMDDAVEAIGWFLDGKAFASADEIIDRLKKTHGNIAVLAARLSGARLTEGQSEKLKYIEAVATAARLLGPQGAMDRSKVHGGPISTISEAIQTFSEQSETLITYLEDRYRRVRKSTRVMPSEAMPAIAHGALTPLHLKAAEKMRSEGEITLSSFNELRRKWVVTRAVMTGGL